MSQRERGSVKLAVVALAFAVVAQARAAPVSAQLPPVADEMSRLELLVGEWTGTGWIEYGPNRRAEFEGTEVVEKRLGGRLVTVEGSYTAVMGPPGTPPKPVHQAFGIFSWDPLAAQFVFRTYTAQGGQGEAHEAQLDDGRIVWSYEDPRMGRVRYTITVTQDGTWQEVGHYSRDDGETWHPFFEMRLTRDGG